MVNTRTCDFSGEDIEPGTGIMYVRNDGTVLHFKDGKAEKNYFMGREARDLEWTEAGRRAKDTRRPQEPEPEPEPEPVAEDEFDTEEAEETDETDETDEDDESDTTPDLEAAEAEGETDAAADADEEDDEE